MRNASNATRRIRAGRAQFARSKLARPRPGGSPATGQPPTGYRQGANHGKGGGIGTPERRAMGTPGYARAICTAIMPRGELEHMHAALCTAHACACSELHQNSSWHHFGISTPIVTAVPTDWECPPGSATLALGACSWDEAPCTLAMPPICAIISLICISDSMNNAH